MTNPRCSIRGELFRTVASQLSQGHEPTYSEERGYTLLERLRVVVCIDNFPLRHHIMPQWFDDIPRRSRVIAACVASPVEVAHFKRRDLQLTHIGGLSQAEARQLIAHRVEDPAVARRLLVDPDWPALLSLIDGRAKALDLIPGQFVAHGSLAPIVSSLQTGEGKAGEGVIEQLFPGSWTILQGQTDARQVMLATSLFPHGVDQRRLTQLTQMSSLRLTEATRRLWYLGLLEPLSRDQRSPRYREHKSVRLFAERHVEDLMRERWIKGWIDEVQARLTRKQIPASYWNTLIGAQKLAPLDHEWHNLRFLLLWLCRRSAGSERYSSYLHSLVLLLAHYFDHRGLYHDRLMLARHLLQSYSEQTLAGLPPDTIREIILLVRLYPSAPLTRRRRGHQSGERVTTSGF